jgi:hypothetical protein
MSSNTTFTLRARKGKGLVRHRSSPPKFTRASALEQTVSLPLDFIGIRLV